MTIGRCLKHKKLIGCMMEAQFDKHPAKLDQTRLTNKKLS